MTPRIRTRTNPRTTYIALASSQGSYLAYAAACFDKVIRVGRTAPAYIVDRLRKCGPLADWDRDPMLQALSPSELIFAVTESWGGNLVLQVALSPNEEVAGSTLDTYFESTGLIGSVNQVKVRRSKIWDTLRHCPNYTTPPTGKKHVRLGPAVRAVVGEGRRDIEGINARAVGLLLASLPRATLEELLETARSTSAAEKAELDYEMMQLLGVPLPVESTPFFMGVRDTGVAPSDSGIE